MLGIEDCSEPNYKLSRIPGSTKSTPSRANDNNSRFNCLDLTVQGLRGVKKKDDFSTVERR